MYHRKPNNKSCSFHSLQIWHMFTWVRFVKDQLVILWAQRETGRGRLISNWGAADRCAPQPAETLPVLLANKTGKLHGAYTKPPRILPRKQTDLLLIWIHFLCNDQNLSLFSFLFFFFIPSLLRSGPMCCELRFNIDAWCGRPALLLTRPCRACVSLLTFSVCKKPSNELRLCVN